jgi:hypothetical protein
LDRVVAGRLAHVLRGQSQKGMHLLAFVGIQLLGGKVHTSAFSVE